MSALFSLPCVGSADGWRIWTSQKFRRRFVKLCGSRQAVWQHIYTLWTAPFEENHGSRQAVWQPASCVAAKYIVDSPSWGEPQMSSSCVAAVKLCGSKYILWNAPLEENYG